MQEEVMARHGLLMLLEVLLLGLVLFWCAPAQQKAAGHKQRVPEGSSLSSNVMDPDPQVFGHPDPSLFTDPDPDQAKT
jgi:hypothetical protein